MKTKELELSEKIERRLEMIHAIQNLKKLFLVSLIPKRVEAWHNGAFIKRWKYWKYVPNIAVGYMLKKYLL